MDVRINQYTIAVIMLVGLFYSSDVFGQGGPVCCLRPGNACNVRPGNCPEEVQCPPNQEHCADQCHVDTNCTEPTYKCCCSTRCGNQCVAPVNAQGGNENGGWSYT